MVSLRQTYGLLYGGLRGQAVVVNYTALDGETLTGTLGGNYKISIAAGATVKLQDVTINGTDSFDYPWAGISCLGNATIILKGTNTVEGFDSRYPGIHVPSGSTLTIKGSGSLNASSNGDAAGLPAVDLSTPGTTTSENTEKEVPPHLLATASDGEALICSA